MSRPFSRRWLGISVVIFMTIELLLGGWVASILAGRRISHMLSLRIELLLSLVSFGIGGFIIGLISPGLRLIEPAAAAAITVVLTFLIAYFTPLRFFGASTNRMLIGGAIAFFIAMFGAHLGEKLTGN